MQSKFQRLIDKFRSPQGVCVEKPIYRRMILARFVKVPLAILVGLLLLSIITIIYTSIPHRIRDPFAVKLKHIGYSFQCTNINNSEIQIQYTWDGLKSTDSYWTFGNVIVFGFNSIPEELLVDDSIVVSRLNSGNTRWYESLSGYTPMVYLEINNNQAERYLAITQVRYGVYGSTATLDNCRDYRWDYIWVDKYTFREIEFSKKLALSSIPVIRAERKAIIIDQIFKYYFITDDLWLGNDPAAELPQKFVGNTKSYWLVENNSYGSNIVAGQGL